MSLLDDAHMSGPQHYREGEVNLLLAEQVAQGDERADRLAVAMAHFAAAQVAATINVDASSDRAAWLAAIR